MSYIRLSSLLYIGPNPYDLSLPHFAFIFNLETNSYQYYNVKYNNYSSSRQLDLGYQGITQQGKFVFSFIPDGTLNIYYNNKLFFSDNIGFSNSSLPTNRGIWVGRYNSYNWNGFISNIKVFNNVIPWASI